MIKLCLSTLSYIRAGPCGKCLKSRHRAREEEKLAFPAAVRLLVREEEKGALGFPAAVRSLEFVRIYKQPTPVMRPSRHHRRRYSLKNPPTEQRRQVIRPRPQLIPIHIHIHRCQLLSRKAIALFSSALVLLRQRNKLFPLKFLDMNSLN